MALLLWLMLGAAIGFAATELFNDDDDATGPPGGSTPDAAPDMAPADDSGQGLTTLVTDGLEAIGGDGQDVFVFDPAADGAITASIDAGGGDDILSLASLFGGPGLSGAELTGGEGNDVIEAAGFESTIAGSAGDDTIEASGFQWAISGGDGNDSIEAELEDSSVAGGAGDDVILVSGGPADLTRVDGDGGNDTLDGRGSENILLRGGEGNDLILTDGATPVGTGFVIAGDGGAGDDTLTHDVEVFPLPAQFPDFAGAQLTGGAGADSFQIVLTTGNGAFSASPDDPLVFVNEAAVITDFVSGTDQITVDLSDLPTGYRATSLTEIEDTEAGTTELLIRLSDLSDTGLPVQVVRIVVAATGLQPLDVQFEGDFPFQRIRVDANAPVPPLPEGAVAVSDGDALIGGGGADVFGFAAGVAGPILTDIAAGDGTDTIDLALDSDAAFLRNATLDGGAGDDVIRAAGDASTILGGAGNDTITIEEGDGNPLGTQSFIAGGDGDDIIISSSFLATIDGGAGADSIAVTDATDGVSVNGGLGNDTITADFPDAERLNYSIDGGEGDDVIMTEGYVFSGTGDAFAATGGAGNDTLMHSVDVTPIASATTIDGIRLAGGDGADQFDIVLTAGTGALAPVDAAAAEVIQAARITDFDPAIDVVRIDLSDALTAFTDVSGIQTEDVSRGTTTFLLRLTGEGGVAQDVSVVVTGTGLSWSDIDFVGAAPTALIVA